MDLSGTSEVIVADIDPVKLEVGIKNPWLTEDVSDFLNYCCPECDFKHKDLKLFSNHALENHSHAADCIGIKNFKTEKIDEPPDADDVKVEAEENYDEFEDNYDEQDSDYIPDESENRKSTRIRQNLSKKDLMKLQDSCSIDNLSYLWEQMSNIPEDIPLSSIVKKPVSYKAKKTSALKKLKRKSRGPYFSKNKKMSSIIIDENVYKCNDTNCKNTSFVTKLEATQHYMKEHLDYIDCDKSQLQVCQYCIEVFQNYHKLERHYDDVHKNLIRTYYKCQICPSALPMTSLKKIKDHYQQVHSKDQNPYQCEVCDDTFLFHEELYMHQLRTHNNDENVKQEILKCENCPFACFSQKIFDVHLHSHNPENEPPIVCNYCEYTNSSMNDFIQHYTEKHLDKEPPFAKCSCCDYFTTKTYKKKIQEHSKIEHGVSNCFFAYKCHKCGKEMSKIELVKTHLETECETKESANDGNGMCELCWVDYRTEEKLRAHYYEKHRLDNYWFCPYCDRKPNDISNLKVHIELRHPEHGEKTHICDICGEGYIFAAGLTAHKYRSHASHVCDICGAAYKNRGSYNEHMINKHNSKPQTTFVCETCGYSSPSKVRLNGHIYKFHSIEKHHRCPCCEYTNHSLLRLKIHIDAIHPEYAEKKFFCNHCPKSFIYKDSLKKHMDQIKEKAKYHPKLDIQCEYCEKRLKSTSAVKEHYKNAHPRQEMILSNYKRYNCTQCKAFYFGEVALKVHFKRVHENYKLNKKLMEIQCDYCEEVLSSTHKIKTHYKNFHPNQPIITEGLEKYTCSECTEFFYLDEELEAHLNLEHGFKTERNYCKKCRIGYRDTHNCNFDTHRKRYQEERKKKKYACKLCTRTFTQEAHLDSHIKTVHENRLDYGCDQCGKKLASSNRLVQHIKQAHSQHVTCDICDKKIANPAQLKRHKVFTHKQLDGAWLCELCPKSVFFSKATYEVHVKQKHE